ncbi:unnamed protein product [Kuraishia capsulata CBS 1993]|uniref:Elongator complex protein 4 n=1 Tax=Kuraishia capsulata CBS 1993 TaxID=1382522 RepID=W6MVB1_9ASCO|nr:uncharacterized protein KUCA_T00005856001 [Kuraishia capsulata CBS 1993]CDK29862.1 unnamed protein product [Kuraishia capsulata CBS 1993]
MSFRRRGDIVGSAVPVRSPPGVVPVQRGPAVGRPVPTATRPLGAKPASHENIPLKHPGVKPSVFSSVPTISTGSADLDRVLGHDGLPLGQSLLLEENGTTDFSSTLLKLFASQGIIHNRLDPQRPNTHIVVIGPDQSWAKALPGLYKGSSREQKKMQIQQNETKISVSNLSNENAPNRDMKIAWRYGGAKEAKNNDTSVSTHPNYTHTFDITSSLIPSPNSSEITYLSIGDSLQSTTKQLESIVKHNIDKVVRIIVPSFLNPALFDMRLCQHQQVIAFLYSLRALLRKYARSTALVISLNLDLFPRDSAIVAMMEKLVDGVLELKPFEPILYEYMERVYKNQPTKIKHGHLNITKQPLISDLGMMTIKEMEFSFKNGRKRFEIEEWSIPVEEEEDEKSQNPTNHESQTTTSIEF